MAQLVVTGASLQCSFGVAPSTLIATPTPAVNGEMMPAATITSNIPIVNIPPFGMCNSLSNPTVAAATSAALGVLTPMPCIPVIPAPWAPGSPTVTIGKLPALTNNSKCNCAWGGMISITNAGTTKTQVA
jgi:Domain of unknown function (DUF4280)